MKVNPRGRETKVYQEEKNGHHNRASYIQLILPGATPALKQDFFFKGEKIVTLIMSEDEATQVNGTILKVVNIPMWL